MSHGYSEREAASGVQGLQALSFRVEAQSFVQASIGLMADGASLMAFIRLGAYSVSVC